MEFIIENITDEETKILERERIFGFVSAVILRII